MLLLGGKVTIFADMLQSLTGTHDVLPGFDSVTILGLAVTFGKCPASVLSVMADSQFWDLLTKPVTSLTSHGFKHILEVVLTNPTCCAAMDFKATCHASGIVSSADCNLLYSQITLVPTIKGSSLL